MIVNIIEKINEYFSELTFVQEGHKYYYRGQSLVSVSKLVDNYVEKVDFNEIAKAIALRDNKTIEEVKQPWIDKTRYACERGTEIHEYAEQEKLIEQKRLEDIAINKFWEELPERYIVIGLEVRMVHKELLYCGTADVVLWDLYTQSIVIVDYKSNEDLFKNYKGKRLKQPFFHLEECPYNKYQIQLSYYQHLLDQLDYPISERWIVHVKDENYKIFKTDDYTLELKQSFKCLQES